jgi:hypothetical protein
LENPRHRQLRATMEGKYPCSIGGRNATYVGGGIADSAPEANGAACCIIRAAPHTYVSAGVVRCCSAPYANQVVRISIRDFLYAVGRGPTAS